MPESIIHISVAIFDTIIEWLGQCTSYSLFHNFDVSQRQFKPDSLIISGQVNCAVIKTSRKGSYRMHWSYWSMRLLRKSHGYFQAHLVTKAFQVGMWTRCTVCLNIASTHPCKLANTISFCHCTSTLFNTNSGCSQDPLSVFPEPLDTTKSPSSSWHLYFPGIGRSNGRTYSKPVWYTCTGK